MPLVLVGMTHLRCIFLRVRGLHFQFIDRVVTFPVYDYELQTQSRAGSTVE